METTREMTLKEYVEVLPTCHAARKEFDQMTSEECAKEESYQSGTSRAVKRVAEALQKDPDYRRSWVANIAMPFQDEWQRTVDSGGLPATREQIHTIANKAAEEFLTNLCR